MSSGDESEVRQRFREVLRQHEAKFLVTSVIDMAQLTLCTACIAASVLHDRFLAASGALKYAHRVCMQARMHLCMYMYVHTCVCACLYVYV